MRFIEQPYSYSFTGNPILFVFDCDNKDMFVCHLTMRKDTQEKVVSFICSPVKTDGVIEYMGQLEVSDVLHSFASYLHPLDDVSSNGEIRYQLSVEGTSVETQEKVAIIGGISNQLFVEYSSLSTNIFEQRFLNTSTMFLLTNRYYDGQKIQLYESEITDFWFLRQRNHTYKLRDVIGEKSWEILDITPSSFQEPYFDKIFFSGIYLQASGSVFDVCVDDVAVFKIEVLQDPLVEEKTILQFRNSFGCLEKILLTGKMKYVPTLKEGEKNIENKNFVPHIHSSRKTMEQKYKVDLGYRKIKDVAFIQDLLMSEEVFIESNIFNTTFPCEVSANINLSVFRNCSRNDSFRNKNPKYRKLFGI